MRLELVKLWISKTFLIVHARQYLNCVQGNSLDFIFSHIIRLCPDWSRSTVNELNRKRNEWVSKVLIDDYFKTSHQIVCAVSLCEYIFFFCSKTNATTIKSVLWNQLLAQLFFLCYVKHIELCRFKPSINLNSR